LAKVEGNGLMEKYGLRKSIFASRFGRRVLL
jgi:hypothetical protein